MGILAYVIFLQLLLGCCKKIRIKTRETAEGKQHVSGLYIKSISEIETHAVYRNQNGPTMLYYDQGWKVNPYYLSHLHFSTVNPSSIDSIL